MINKKLILCSDNLDILVNDDIGIEEVSNFKYTRALINKKNVRKRKVLHRYQENRSII